jgi:hypothetical protein
VRVGHDLNNKPIRQFHRPFRGQYLKAVMNHSREYVYDDLCMAMNHLQDNRRLQKHASINLFGLSIERAAILTQLGWVEFQMAAEASLDSNELRLGRR